MTPQQEAQAFRAKIEPIAKSLVDFALERPDTDPRDLVIAVQVAFRAILAALIGTKAVSPETAVQIIMLFHEALRITEHEIRETGELTIWGR